MTTTIRSLFVMSYFTVVVFFAFFATMMNETLIFFFLFSPSCCFVPIPAPFAPVGYFDFSEKVVLQEVQWGKVVQKNQTIKRKIAIKL